MLAGTAAVAATPPLFETLRWTAPGAEYAALYSQPSACLSYDPSNKPLVQAGQALFNTPTLLGGQAAKAGLTCASCHVNGRNNPHFLLTGVSDKPGTADVTNSFFSAARGNARFDPILIPDLAMPGNISHNPETRELEPFIRTLIVEEFSGHEPSPAMLDALSAYVRAIQSCPDGDKTQVPRKLEDQRKLAQAALLGSIEMVGRDDRQASQLLIAAARHQLSLISERYAGQKFKRERASLLKLSRELQNLTNTRSTPAQFSIAVTDWLVRFDKNVGQSLVKNEAVSLYDPTRLVAEMGKQATRP